MKRLEIERIMPAEDSMAVESIVLVDKEAALDAETIRMINEAEDDQFVWITYGKASAVVLKGSILTLIETEVEV